MSLKCLTSFTNKFTRLMSGYTAPAAHSICPVQSASLKENCILVNEKDEVTGYGSKRFCHLVAEDGAIPLHRAFSVFLFNSKNELLLQKRSDSKLTFPGHFTNTCCSHPLYDIPGERVEYGAVGVKQAARRRLQHELGIPRELVSPDDLKFMTRVLYKSQGNGIWGEHEVDYILFLKKDLPIEPNPDEVSSTIYVSKRDFDDFLLNLQDPITPWFELISRNGLKNWWDNLESLQKFQNHQKVLSLK